MGQIKVEVQEAAPAENSSQARRPRNIRLAIVATALLGILVLGGGGVAAYSLLSSTFTPERAVMDYFAAQSRGDVSGMMANATFQQGSNRQFFDQPAIAAMMNLPQNKDVRSVKVVSSQTIDATTRSVAVSMMWGGQHRSQTYTVRKDNSGFHDLIFRSWRVAIPFATIHITLPNQPGPVQVDGITPTTSDVSSVQAVDGYHLVTMGANDFYVRASQVVDAVDSPPNAEFTPGAISPGTASLAAAAVKLAFPNCDTALYSGCLNHTYNAPNDGRRWFVSLPGYGDVFYTSYRVTLVGDPTSDMQLAVSADAGKVNASGTCTVTVTFDGTRDYNLAGPWTATLTLESGRFIADLASNCWANKA